MRSKPLNLSQRLCVGFLSLTLMMTVALLAPAMSAESTSEAYPSHVDLATVGVVMGMRGQQLSGNGLAVRLAEDVTAQLQEPGFDYDGFILHKILINGYASVEGQAGNWNTHGLLIFEDLASRRAYAQFSAYYQVEEGEVEVYLAGVRTVTPTTPTFVWFALRKNDVTPEMLDPQNHAALVKLAATRSLSSVPSNVDDYVVFALSMDRFADTEQTLFTADDSDVSVTSLNLGGWPVGIFTGRMNPDRIGGEMSVHVSGEDFVADDITLQAFPTRPFEWEG